MEALIKAAQLKAEEERRVAEAVCVPEQVMMEAAAPMAFVEEARRHPTFTGGGGPIHASSTPLCWAIEDAERLRMGSGSGGLRRISTANAVLLACAAHISLSIADGFFKAPVYTYSPWAFWAFDAFKFVVVPAIALAWLWIVFSLKPSSYGLRKQTAEDWFRIALLAIVLAVALNFIYLLTSRRMLAWIGSIGSQDFHYASLVQDGSWRFPAALYFGLTAGFVEEISFRGLPLLYLRERNIKPDWRYALVTSVLFAAAHWENGVHELVATFVFSVAAGVAYLKLKDLWPLVGAHALIDVWNFS